MIESTLTWVTALIGTVGSLAVTGFLLRRRQKQSQIFQMMAYQSLGSKKGIAALKVGGEVLLVGITPAGFRVLKSFPAAELIESSENPLGESLKRLRRLKEEIHESPLGSQ